MVPYSEGKAIILKHNEFDAKIKVIKSLYVYV
jgi:hypothetical protein